MNRILLILFTSLIFQSISAQKGGTAYTSASTFIDYQKAFPRASEAMNRREDTLQKQFAQKKLKWPANFIYIRSFKYDSQLEIWVKNNIQDTFQLFKTYRVCALAGTLGPKRIEGDYQVPEGFYYINEFNPKSSYHLSLGINYPNSSDRILSDVQRPGGDIYIHGSCVTVGCIPVTDPQIEEIYILSAHAKNQGQDFIPVHIFPIRFTVKRSQDYLNNLMFNNPSLKPFTEKLKEVYNYFERFRQLPVITTDDKGQYMVHTIHKEVIKTKLTRPSVVHRQRTITELADVVHQWPEFPGGGKAFLSYLDKVGKEMSDLLPANITKAHVQVEFIVDKDGTPTNFKVINGVNNDFNEDLITRLEKMPIWKPAMLHDKAVAKKMKQSFTIEFSSSLTRH
ncbi:MAG: L,D-transpeptidase family protein [Chitinophagaceae bacterium]|jgi:murein L,D-transpeptidase YafK|nr:L,D-transpeptidase family protein [Chitinophagaceae bacterium]